MDNKSNSGFTLIEILTIVFIVGIMSAIAAPSFLGMHKRQQFNGSVDRILGSMQITQREAMRRSKSCILTIPEGANITLTSTCQLLDDSLLKNATIDHIRWDEATKVVTDVTGSLQSSYNFKGNPIETVSGVSLSDHLTIVSAVDGNHKKCIVTSIIGAIRAGNWDGVNCVVS